MTPAVLLLAAIALTLPIYYFGMPGGNDLPQHYRFVQTFYDAVRDGDLYPSWPGDTNLGFGDLGIRFYPPLAYYAVVIFRSVTESWTTALAATIFFWFFVGGLGVFLLARESFSEKASLVAAVVFMAMPYHVNQIYNAGLFAEFAGLAILPFCFLFTRRVIYSGKLFDMAGLAISFALLILAHLPLVVIGSIGLAVYAILNFKMQTILITVAKLGSAVLAALAASSFYWTRMVAELDMVSHSLPQFAERKYGFAKNFLAAILYMPSTEYGETSAWFTDLLFAITLAMIIPGIAILLHPRFRAENRRMFPLLGVLIAAVFISTPVSMLLWENIGFLEKIQFPWRFLGLISLVGSVLIGGCIDNLAAIFKTRLRPMGLIAVGLIIAGIVFTGAQVIRPATYSSRLEFDKQFDRYKGDESYECWWPVGADRRALLNPERVSSPSRQVDISHWTSTDRAFAISEGAEEEEEVRIATFYYPFWKATINGENVPVSRAEDGTMLIAIPPQRSAVRLFFAEPVHETVGKYISIAAWILIAAGLIIVAVTKLKQPKLV